ncbi:MAG: hypothetical protein KDC15_12970 [Chitinophagaceae bacterium]|nr:hypothetical protein [Chitinophagaceae bacterium]
MKKLISILFLSMVVKSASAQLDTLAYLKTFEQQKMQYIGQPFSILLAAMGQVQPKSVWRGRNIKHKNQIHYCSFYFVNPNNMQTIGTIYMTIDWQTSILLDDINYYTNRNHYNFTSEERLFYGNKIIKDIKVFVY